jgi:myo-inositol 2-dehydrogenase / D-chiro-inositol 1-dehydrogenase
MEKLKIGIIGAGRIGKVHTETIAQNILDAEIKTIADTNIVEAQELAARFQVNNVTKNYVDILQDKEISAVIICSPTNTHAKYIVEAARAGKHIFCEKPVDLDIATIQNAIKVVEECGVKLMVGFNRRFDPNFKKIKEMVIAGKIGEPQILKIT